MIVDLSSLLSFKAVLVTTGDPEAKAASVELTESIRGLTRLQELARIVGKQAKDWMLITWHVSNEHSCQL
jgi:hypothetical protein